MSEHFTEADPAAQIASLWHGTSGNLQPGDVTLEEMAEAWGCSRGIAQDRLSKLEAEGKVTRHRRNRPGDGHIMVVWRMV